MPHRLHLILNSYEMRSSLIKKLILIIFSLLALGLLLLHPTKFAVNAAEPTIGQPVNVCNGAKDGASFGTTCKQSDDLIDLSGSGNPVRVILDIATYMIVTGLVIAVVYFVLAGWKLLTSQGDSKKVEEATKTITYAVLGMVVMTLSFFLTSTIIGLLT